MQKVFTRERIILYSVMTIIYLLLRSVSDAHSFPDYHTERSVNNAWRMLWITPLHLLFFEWTLGQWHRRGWLRSLLLLVAHIFLWSVGLMFWRDLGIALRIYTPIGDFRSR
ncbi:MAG: hypothetical protein EOO15_19525, partial [Chitinophagaceae bacterium]